MNTLTDDNASMLADSARRYVERACTADARAASLASEHGCSPHRWRELADMGWLALPLPEQHGGLGGSLAEICALADELGAALLTEPFISCGVMAASLLAACGNAEQCAQWLPALAAGDKRVAWALWDRGSRCDASQITTRAEPAEGGYRLNGHKELVLGAGGADAFIVSALCPSGDGSTQAALFLVETPVVGLALQPYAMIDGRHAAHVTLQDLHLPATARLDGHANVAQAVDLEADRAMLVHCAEAAGAMAQALKITLDYLKTRTQFGRVLASYQALQHRLVDLHVAIEEARALVHAAVQAFSGTDAQRTASVAAAKAYASQAARLVWEESVQMHGAIGMTDDYQLSRYVKHLAAFGVLFGDADVHLERLARIEDQLHRDNPTTPPETPP